MKIQHIFTFILSCLLASACDDPDCINQGGTDIKIGFYSDQNGRSQNVRINRLALAGLNTLIIEEQEEVNFVILPINPSVESITAYFDTEYGLDTLEIGYSRNTQFISADCGVDTRFGAISLIRCDFDSARVVNTSTDINFLNSSTVNENIKVFN